MCQEQINHVMGLMLTLKDKNYCWNNLLVYDLVINLMCTKMIFTFFSKYFIKRNLTKEKIEAELTSLCFCECSKDFLLSLTKPPNHSLHNEKAKSITCFIFNKFIICIKRIKLTNHKVRNVTNLLNCNNIKIVKTASSHTWLTLGFLKRKKSV